MHTDGFETEAKLRREIAALQEKVAGLMEMQIRGEAYRTKILREYAELETENDFLKSEIGGLRQQLAHPEEAARQAHRELRKPQKERLNNEHDA